MREGNISYVCCRCASAGEPGADCDAADAASEYRFSVDSRLDTLDQNVVLGLFTYDHSPEYSHREIDVEASRFGDPGALNGQYVIQPWNSLGNRRRSFFVT